MIFSRAIVLTAAIVFFGRVFGDNISQWERQCHLVFRIQHHTDLLEAFMAYHPKPGNLIEKAATYCSIVEAEAKIMLEFYYGQLGCCFSNITWVYFIYLMRICGFVRIFPNEYILPTKHVILVIHRSVKALLEDFLEYSKCVRYYRSTYVKPLYDHEQYIDYLMQLMDNVIDHSPLLDNYKGDYKTLVDHRYSLSHLLFNDFSDNIVAITDLLKEFFFATMQREEIEAQLQDSSNFANKLYKLLSVQIKTIGKFQSDLIQILKVILLKKILRHAKYIQKLYTIGRFESFNFISYFSVAHLKIKYFLTDFINSFTLHDDQDLNEVIVLFNGVLPDFHVNVNCQVIVQVIVNILTKILKGKLLGIISLDESYCMQRFSDELNDGAGSSTTALSSEEFVEDTILEKISDNISDGEHFVNLVENTILRGTVNIRIIHYFSQVQYSHEFDILKEYEDRNS